MHCGWDGFGRGGCFYPDPWQVDNVFLVSFASPCNASCHSVVGVPDLVSDIWQLSWGGPFPFIHALARLTPFHWCKPISIQTKVQFVQEHRVCYRPHILGWAFYISSACESCNLTYIFLDSFLELHC